jgi:hypothetical protein
MKSKPNVGEFLGGAVTRLMHDLDDAEPPTETEKPGGDFRKHFLLQRLARFDTTLKGKQRITLTSREQKIWAVIQQGFKGRLYCQALGRASIGPPRTGVWSNAPRTYLAAYDQGTPWRHRIQDEKSKICSKARKLGTVLSTFP